MDTTTWWQCPLWLPDQLPLLSRRRQNAEPVLPPLPIIEHLDVFRNLPDRLQPSPTNPMMSQLGFKFAEEAFYQRVVVAIPLATYRRSHPELGQKLLVASGAKLVAPVGTVGQLGGRLLSDVRPEQNLPHRFLRHPFRHGLTNDIAGAQVPDHCQGQPPLVDQGAGDVGNQNPIRFGGCKVLFQPVRRHRQVVLWAGRRLELPSLRAVQVVFAPNPFDLMNAGCDALNLQQFLLKFRCRAPPPLVCRFYRDLQAGLRLLAFGRFQSLEGMITTEG